MAQDFTRNRMYAVDIKGYHISVRSYRDWEFWLVIGANDLSWTDKLWLGLEDAKALQKDLAEAINYMENADNG